MASASSLIGVAKCSPSRNTIPTPTRRSESSYFASWLFCFTTNKLRAVSPHNSHTSPSNPAWLRFRQTRRTRSSNALSLVPNHDCFRSSHFSLAQGGGACPNFRHLRSYRQLDPVFRMFLTFCEFLGTCGSVSRRLLGTY